MEQLEMGCGDCKRDEDDEDEMKILQAGWTD